MFSENLQLSIVFQCFAALHIISNSNLVVFSQILFEVLVAMILELFLASSLNFELSFGYKFKCQILRAYLVFNHFFIHVLREWSKFSKIKLLANNT